MAIITDDLRRLSAQQLIDAIADATGTYYVGIGKSDPWLDADDSDEDAATFEGLPAPVPSSLYERETLENLSSLSKVLPADAYRVIPRYNLAPGAKYKVYDPNDASCFEQTGDIYPCYAMNTSQELFLCLRNGSVGTAATTIAMSAQNVTNLNLVDAGNGWGDSDSDVDSGPIEQMGIFRPNGVDGTGDYVWAYLGKVATSSGFYTSSYITIPARSSVFSGDANTDSDTPYETSGGLLYGFKIDSGGSGYSAPILIVTARLADGTSITLSSAVAADAITVAETGSVITQVDYDIASIIGRSVGSAYVPRVQDIVWISCRIETVGAEVGKGAVITPLFAPIEGFGGDNLSLLPSYYVGIKAEFPNTLGDTDGWVGSASLPYTFRQVSLIANPTLTPEQGAGGDTDPQYADCLRSIQLNSGSSPAVSFGDIIWQSIDGASATSAEALENGDPVAFVDEYDSTNKKIWYHQNNADNVTTPRYNAAEFVAGTVYVNTTTNSAIIDSLVGTEYNPYITSSNASGFGSYKQNGQLLFVNNSGAIQRAVDQTEQVRIIIQF